MILRSFYAFGGQEMKLKVTHTFSYIPIQQISVSQLKSLDKVMSFIMKGAFFSPAYQRHGWDGRIKLLKKVYKKGCRGPLLGYKFPTGLLDEFRKLFKDTILNLDFELSELSEYDLDQEFGKYKLRPYQKFAVEKMLKKRRGIVYMATGSGKSLIAAAVIKIVNKPCIVTVPTLDILYQTRHKYSEYLGIPENEIGVIGDQEYDPKKITIASVPSLRNMLSSSQGRLQYRDEEVKRFFKSIQLVISDEAHMVGDNTFYDVFMAFTNAEFRYGMSATPFDRTDGNTLMLTGATGPVIAKVTSEDLMKRGVLAIPDITIYKISEPRMSSAYTYQKAYKEGIVDNAIRNEKIINIVKENLGKKILIINEWKRHGRTLSTLLNQEGIDHKLLHGEISGKIRDEARREFEEGDLNVLLASFIFKLGVDLPSIQVLIRADGRASTITTIQILGRALRISKDKTTVQVYDFFDAFQKHLAKHSRARLKDYYSLGSCVKINQIDINSGERFLAF